MNEQVDRVSDTPPILGRLPWQRADEMLADNDENGRPPPPEHNRESTEAPRRVSEGYEPFQQGDGPGPPPYPSDSRAMATEGGPFMQSSETPDTDPESGTQVEDTSPPTHSGASRFALSWLFKRESQPSASAAPNKSGRSGEIWKVWWPEALSVLFGFLSLIVIVVVLDKFNEQSLPDWPYNITLNTFLAVVSIFARAAFMFPVSVVISQSQWTWFLNARPLHDFHLLDQASRSPWGSLILLWRAPVFRHPVALGALLTVVGILTSPVTQLSITYPVRDVLDASVEASVPSLRSVRFPGDGLAHGMRKALSLGFISDATNYTRTLEPPSGASCSTGNCTFAPYHSLGVCVRTANITSHLVVDEFEDNAQRGGTPLMGYTSGDFLVPDAKVYTASLPGGFDLSHQGPMAVLRDIMRGNQSFGFSTESEEDAGPLRARIASFVNVYAVPLAVNASWTGGSLGPEQLQKIFPSISSFRHEATEILFYFCVQTYETSIVNGVEENRLVGQLARPIDDPAEGAEVSFLDINCTSVVHDKNTGCDPNPSRWADVLRLEVPESDDSPEGEVDNTSAGTKEAFSVNYQAMETMARFMKIILAGYAMNIYDPVLFPNGTYFTDGLPFSLTIFEDVLYRLDSSTNLTNNAYRDTRLTNLYVNIATTLSSMLRVGVPQRYTQDVFNTTGEARREAAYVHVTWGWLAFLGGELVLASALIAITAAGKLDGGGPKEPRSVPPGLKDSSLAILSALSPECRELMGEGIRPIQELKARSKELKVRLEGGEIVPAEHGEASASLQQSSIRS